MAELEGVELTCQCEGCRHFFRCSSTDGPRHVFRTDTGRMRVLCDWCITVARFNRHAREVLSRPAALTPKPEASRPNLWGSE